MALSVGDRLGRYEILAPVGAGGMGEVYRALDTGLGREVAVKVLPAEVASDPARLARFELEAKALSRLSHPSILDIHDIGREGEVVFVVTELLRGRTLQELIAEGPLGWRRAVEIAAAVAEGLDASHRAGVIHRDLKPANLFITTDDRVKILDFGLAVLVRAGTTTADPSSAPMQEPLTQPGAVVGTTGYMSPEQVRGEPPGVPTDIFSLGCVLYEMLTGQRAFAGGSAADTLVAVLTRDPPAVQISAGEVPEEVERILRRCLEKEPERRFGSAGDLAGDLRSVLAGARPGVAAAGRGSRVGRRWVRRTLIGAGSLVALLAVLLVWMSVHPTLAFGSRDKVLVADVDNRTGEPVFDLALRTAIEYDVQQSQYAIVFDRGQLAETLRLMRRDPGSLVDEALGCDVCRFSGVRALVVPRIAAAGNAYELQAILVDPVRGRHVDRIRVTALGREQVLLEAVDELAREVRARLGESMASIEESDVPTVQVTTSSWQALQSFAKAQKSWMDEDYGEAAGLLELALEEDPKFATARASLGLARLQFLGQTEEGKQDLRRALADSGGLPRREQMMIRATTLHRADGDLQGALAQYRMVVELYPDDYAALNNSGMILRELGRYDEALAMYGRAAELAPRSTVPLSNMYGTHMFFRHDPYGAEDAARRLVELGPEVANFHSVLAWSLVAQGRLEEALPELRQAVKLLPHHRYALPNLAHVLLALGRAREAVPVYEQLRDLAVSGELPSHLDKCDFDLALANLAAGRREVAVAIAEEGRQAMEKRWKQQPPSAEEMLVQGELCVLAGDTGRAEGMLAGALAAGVNDPDSLVLAAELHALLGEREASVETLRRALAAGYADRFFPRILPAFHWIRTDPSFRALFDVKRSAT